MKQLLFMLSMFAILVTSCAKDDTAPVSNESTLVSFKVNTPDIQTRYGEGTTANKLLYAVYQNGNLLENISVLDLEDAVEINLSTNVELQLINGLTYDILFWAQAEDAPYTFDGEKVTIDYSDLSANEEKYDAFFRNYKAEITGTQPHSVELRRPFAQLNIGTSDIATAQSAGFDVVSTSIAVTSCTELNLMTGVASEPQEITFAMNAKADDTYGEKPDTYDIISMNYLLVDKDKELTDVKFYIEGSNNNIEREYFNIPVQRNYRTYILGKLLSSTTNFEVKIDPIFEDEELFPEEDEQPVTNFIIYYTSEDEEIIEPEASAFDANIVDNIYEDGQGKIFFDNIVTVIGKDAFAFREKLTGIIIPESITEIGEWAFYACGMAKVSIPASVTKIGESAFAECALECVVIPNTVKLLEDRAFNCCADLIDVKIGSGITEIRKETFQDCYNLRNITIPDNIKTIGEGAFRYCDLERVIIPNSVTIIGDGAFDENNCLSSVTIGNGVVEIGESAFRCSELESVTIPDNVKTIGAKAFADCPLKSVSIGNGVTTIGNGAFSYSDYCYTVYCATITPPTGNYGMFSSHDMDGSITIYVPTESVDAYKAADGWSGYADRIEGYDFE